MVFDEEKLIILVSQYPEIHNQQNENYMNTQRKNNIWKEIGKEMGASSMVCKEKWKSLRDSFHRNLKNRKCKSGDGASKIKKWKYELQMEFLLPYLQERNTKDNFENANENTNDDTLPEIMTTSPEPVNSPPSSSSATSLIYRSNTARKKNQPTQNISVASTLQSYLASRQKATESESDPIHSFFKAMADTVKTLPVDLQLTAKKKVYAIVSDLEFENLLRVSTPSQVNQQQQQPLTQSNNQSEIVVDDSRQQPLRQTNNQSQIVVDDSQKRFIITSDGFLIPLEESESHLMYNTE